MAEAAAPAWPLVLDYEELGRHLAALGLTPEPASPVTRFLTHHAEHTTTDAPPAAIVPALKLLAAPRQLLLARVGSDPVQLCMFLSDGASIARFDLGSDGCAISEPCAPAAFAAFVRALARTHAATPPPISLSRSWLDLMRELQRIGLLVDDAMPLPLATVTAAIVAQGGGRDAADVLGELEDDGVITVADGYVRPTTAWLELHRHLVYEAEVRIRAFEVDDLLHDRRREKSLLLLGAQADAVVFVPPRPIDLRMDAVLDVLPATAEAVGVAVSQLLEPPLAPPSAPLLDCHGDPSKWLTPSLDPPASVALLPAWNADHLEDIALRSERGEAAAPPAVLLAPSATVEILARDRDRGSVERHVFGLDGRHVVEWYLEGSLIRWRELDAAAARTRIDGLAIGELPASPGTRPSEPSDPPRRCVVRATARVNGIMRSCNVLVACYPGVGAWLVDDAVQTSSRPISGPDLRRELCDAWKPLAAAGARAVQGCG